ncbi:sensor histidine kinase [Dyadobacter arcticus]|uniref:Signal transduction histidine kinase internal region domain-containing protein n=1 Tax=Dyadobacter arcticus TaxID=1078754 RepID=A0ABX0UIR9_9BACT|nr:histidine kinase [Dyadobacter arcticus]NIJ52702.1 hypothetical protein [Dyadobacter arcticus]
MSIHLPTNRIVRHLLFWTLVYLFFFGLQVVIPLLLFGRLLTDVSTDWVMRWENYLLIHLPIMLFYSYSVAYKMVPLVLKRQYTRFSLHLALVVILTWLLFGVLRLSYVAIPTLMKQPARLWYATLTQILSHNLFLLDFIASPFFRINIAAGLMVSIKLFKQWRQKQQENQLFEREKLQNELQLLKLQLNPNFLFGFLRALYALTQQQSTLAPEAVLKFAHFLRYVLYESQANQMPLVREIEIIDHYVSLQRSIHPAGLEVSLSVRGNPGIRTVAPLLLFQIVEHAFRDLSASRPNLETDEPAWVSIDLAMTEVWITLKVIDGQSVNLTDNSKQLADLQKQLYFYYADSYEFQVQAEPDAYIVTLSLPFVRSTASSAGRLENSQSSLNYEITLPDR